MSEIELLRILPNFFLPKNRWFNTSSQVKWPEVVDKSISPVESQNKLELSELVPILIRKYTNEESPVISAAFGDPDFLPFAFLSQGIRIGEAVCRISRLVTSSKEDRPEITASQIDLTEEVTIEDHIKLILEVEQAFQALQKDGKSFILDGNEISKMLGINEAESKKIFQSIRNLPDSKPSSVLKDSSLRPKLLSLMRSVEINGEKQYLIPYGTGFLVGRNQIMTNFHVLGNYLEKGHFVAEFGYEKDRLGRDLEPVICKIDPDELFYGDKDLDFTLIGLSTNTNLDDSDTKADSAKPDKKADSGTSNKKEFFIGEYLGWIPVKHLNNAICPSLTKESLKEYSDSSEPEAILLAELESKNQEVKVIVENFLDRDSIPGAPTGIPGEPVNIIQHPRGKQKEIVLSNNRLQKITKDFLGYEADVDFSSSGSPVFNSSWQLVGLHHATILGSYVSTQKMHVIYQQGVRITSIVDHLEKAIQFSIHIRIIIVALKVIYAERIFRSETYFDREPHAHLISPCTSLLRLGLERIVLPHYPRSQPEIETEYEQRKSELEKALTDETDPATIEDQDIIYTHKIKRYVLGCLGESLEKAQELVGEIKSALNIEDSNIESILGEEISKINRLEPELGRELSDPSEIRENLRSMQAKYIEVFKETVKLESEEDSLVKKVNLTAMFASHFIDLGDNEKQLRYQEALTFLLPTSIPSFVKPPIIEPLIGGTLSK